jgi:hypothetical protein
MSSEIWVAIISAAASLVGVIVTVVLSNKLTLYRIEQLEKKVDTFTNERERLYIAEGHIKELQHEMRYLHTKENII